MAQQTAVEWLEQELKRNRLVNDSDISMNIETAKRIEKEQKADEYKRGWEDATTIGIKESHKYQ
jgi:hypothetical protein